MNNIELIDSSFVERVSIIRTKRIRFDIEYIQYKVGVEQKVERVGGEA